MQTSSPGSRRWLGPTLLWGAPLGLLQVGIIINGLVINNLVINVVRLNWPQSIGLGALLYVLIPTIAGFSITRMRDGVATEGTSIGWKVGLCSLLIIVIFVVAEVAIALLFPPQPSVSHTLPVPPVFAALFVAAFFLFLIGLNSIDVVLAFLGGFFGGWLGRRTISSAREG